MIREAVFYFKVKPLLKRLKELSQMPLTVTRFLQMVALVVQILNLALPIVPDKYKVYVLTAVGICQILLHNFAGNRNPDGTPAALPYQPLTK